MAANMTAVRSSNVAAVGWDADAQELVVEFANGAVYAYPAAGQSAYQDLLTAPSPGGYVARWLKGQPARRIS